MSRRPETVRTEDGERAEQPVDSRARFTGRGWAFLGTGTLCLLLATWLGRKDVLALALFLGGAPLFAALSLYLVKPRVLLKRGVDPALVTAGDSAVVRLRVRHRSRRAGRAAGAAGAVAVHERVPEPLGGDRELSVQAGGEPAAYTVRPRRRGVYALGPATVRVADPFGLAAELLDASERTSLHVAPDPVELPEIRADRLRESGTDPARTAQPQPGPDNVTVREYRHGDPVRRVHWAASARQGTLMVRQEDPRSIRRLSLLLDLDDTAWPGERQWAGVLPSTAEFEWAVSFTAAVLEHLTQRETAVHALDTRGRPLPRGGEDDDAAVRGRVTAIDDDAAEDARHGLARVRPLPVPGRMAGSRSSSGIPGTHGGRGGRADRGGSGSAGPDSGRGIAGAFGGDGSAEPGSAPGARPEAGAGAGADDGLADRFDRDGLVHPVLLVSGDLDRAGAQRILHGTHRAGAGSAVLVASAADRVPDGAAVLEAAGWSVVVVTAATAPEEAWAHLGTGSRTAGALR
ncbi:DUF58 domain-containing protein [Kocuria sediminis]|uniref:DUF58 domain-containing protein n=1 Tax=Kocuria sediminis TaxID=1038857 RepID=UPI001F10EC22|nr:DUF58 domain-containing protein [Kocuria sediminis]